MAKGLLSNEELIDTMILDCNNAVKAIADGQMILWCKIMYEMVTKLANLKNGIRNELKNRDENIALLEQRLKEAGHEVIKSDIEEFGGEVNGSN